MRYCPENISISEVWVNGGTSQCFMDTVTTACTATWLTLLGTIQLRMYRKFGSRIDLPLPQSKLYVIQIFLIILLLCSSVARFLVQVVMINHYEVYGYMVCLKLYLKNLQ